ncbi:MAG: uncharacterized protein KVP18_002300 [Porospora cf. gigantea A]|nr:MAG: hypothetical protein KVP18_002300 [Porospora cf. gigantea A]
MYNIANLVTVGALTITGSKASFSNYGDEVDLMAPGQYTPGLGDFTDSDIIKFVSGTSFSSPIVTAAIAMALALRPNESNQNIFTAAYDSASYSETIPGSYAKSGALNAYGLLRNTVTPGVYAGQKLKSSGFRVAAPLVIAICVVLLL